MCPCRIFIAPTRIFNRDPGSDVWESPGRQRETVRHASYLTANFLQFWPTSKVAESSPQAMIPFTHLPVSKEAWTNSA